MRTVSVCGSVGPFCFVDEEILDFCLSISYV